MFPSVTDPSNAAVETGGEVFWEGESVTGSEEGGW